ncbi:hypothetical protein [Leisingera methylohalidivorans]|uniref:Uncharacterized protein n=1 Tax=Leisingera methylohalidivorans DSM 14336 TaxID=999552 RepID=V9VVJ4_9RHOB|nr:hypothetical protein [Leisingera methylohalidivorans]AHD00897.1 hypothetical protein METH_09590 [Leisingera methylohalidivorans DSM 14336]
MDNLTSKTIAVFLRPFTVPGFDETLPAGEYDIETELSAPPGHLDPQAWKASVQIHLHPRTSYPGLERSLTVSLAELEAARAKDKLSGMDLSKFFLEEMLADPMVRLVMEADGVSETQIRQLYSGLHIAESASGFPDHDAAREPQSDLQERLSIQAAENEGMPSRAERPSRKHGSPPTEPPRARQPCHER